MRDALGGIQVCALLHQLARPAVGNRGIDLAQAERVGLMRLQSQLVRRRFRPLPLRQRQQLRRLALLDHGAAELLRLHRAHEAGRRAYRRARKCAAGPGVQHVRHAVKQRPANDAAPAGLRLFVLPDRRLPMVRNKIKPGRYKPIQATAYDGGKKNEIEIFVLAKQ